MAYNHRMIIVDDLIIVEQKILKNNLIFVDDQIISIPPRRITPGIQNADTNPALSLL